MLYITEYQKLASDASGNTIPTGHEPARVRQSRPVGGTANYSDPIDSATRFVRVHAAETILIAFGRDQAAADPSAGHRMPAGAIEFFGVTPGTVIGFVATA